MPTTPLGDVRPPKSTASRLPNGRRLAWSGCAWLLLQSMIVGQGLEPIADQQPPGAAPVRSEEAPPPSTPTSPAAAEVENFFPDDPAVTGPAAVGPAASDSTTTPSPAAVPATTPSAVPATTTAEEPAAAAGVTLAEVDELRKRVEAAELTEEQRKQAATSLQQAAEDVAATDKLRGATIDFQERKQGQQATRDTLQLEIESLQNTELATPDMELPLATLESQLLELKTGLAKANTELDTYLSELKGRPARREVLRTGIFSQPGQLATAQSQLQAAPPAGEPTILTETFRLAARSRKGRLEQLLPAYTAELAWMDGSETHDLPRLRRELMERLVNLKKQEVQNWETRLQEKRQDVIARRIDLAMAQAQLAPEALSSIYAENAEIPKEERRIRDDAADVRAQTDAVRKDIVDLQARYGDLQDRDATAAGSTALGYRLRQQRDVLPEVATLRHEINARLETLEDARITALDWSEKLDGLRHVEEAATEFIALNPPPDDLSEELWRERSASARNF